MTKVLGYDKLQGQLKKLENLDTKEAELAMARLVLEQSQNSVPVNTGELKESGHIEEGEEVQVVYDAAHAVFVEFGTYKMPARPFLRTAIDNNERQIVKDAGTEIEDEIERVI